VLLCFFIVTGASPAKNGARCEGAHCGERECVGPVVNQTVLNVKVTARSCSTQRPHAPELLARLRDSPPFSPICDHPARRSQREIRAYLAVMDICVRPTSGTSRSAHGESGIEIRAPGGWCSNRLVRSQPRPARRPNHAHAGGMCASPSLRSIQTRERAMPVTKPIPRESRSSVPGHASCRRPVPRAPQAGGRGGRAEADARARAG